MIFLVVSISCSGILAGNGIMNSTNVQLFSNLVNPTRYFYEFDASKTKRNVAASPNTGSPTSLPITQLELDVLTELEQSETLPLNIMHYADNGEIYKISRQSRVKKNAKASYKTSPQIKDYKNEHRKTSVKNRASENETYKVVVGKRENLRKSMRARREAVLATQGSIDGVNNTLPDMQQNKLLNSTADDVNTEDHRHTLPVSPLQALIRLKIGGMKLANSVLKKTFEDRYNLYAKRSLGPAKYFAFAKNAVQEELDTQEESVNVAIDNKNKECSKKILKEADIFPRADQYFYDYSTNFKCNVTDYDTESAVINSLSKLIIQISDKLPAEGFDLACNQIDCDKVDNPNPYKLNSREEKIRDWFFCKSESDSIQNLNEKLEPGQKIILQSLGGLVMPNMPINKIFYYCKIAKFNPDEPIILQESKESTPTPTPLEKATTTTSTPSSINEVTDLSTRETTYETNNETLPTVEMPPEDSVISPSYNYLWFKIIGMVSAFTSVVCLIKCFF